MRLDALWSLLHFFFAFSFVGTLILFDWNGRAARATQDWGQRALLFDIMSKASRTVGTGSLILLGVWGNLLAVSRGWRMSAEPWLQLVNALWIAALIVMFMLVIPGAGRLLAMARAGADGRPDPAWSTNLVRWRVGNVLMSLLYVSLLALMVFRWRS